MGKPLVRFCEGPGNNEGRWVRGTRHAVVACDEASNESLISVFDSHDYLETPVYSKVLRFVWSNGVLECWSVEKKQRYRR